VRRRPLLLLCLVVLAGCGGTSTDVTVPDGFTVRTVKTPSLSIALPTVWRSFADRRADAPVKLVGALQERGRKLVTNMNVVQTRAPSSLTFDQMKRTEARQLELAAGAKSVQQTETELPAGRALRLSYHTRKDAFVQQYFVRRNDLLYVLTYTTRSGDAARYSGIFDRSAHTFQVR
jgi:hypothetical protein